MIFRTALVATLLLGAAAQVEAGVRGEVVSTRSRWGAQGDVIVTDVAVRGDDGALITTVQLGGTVDGVGMAFSHTRAPARLGDIVELAADRSVIVRTEHAHHNARRRPAGGLDSGPGVQRTSISSKPLFHPTGCVNFQYDADPGDASFSNQADTRWLAFDAAFKAWEVAADDYACGGVSFFGTAVENAPEGRDGVNTIHFRQREWCRPATQTEPKLCHDDGAVAVTRILYVDDPGSLRDGEILEIDIDFNAVDYTFSMDGSPGMIDLQSAATHEIGHALGLDHNCGVENGAWPMDRDGNLVPSCESLSPELTRATMYVQVQPGTTTMRVPQASDVDGMCEAVRAVCTSDVEGAGCSAGSPATAWSILAFAPFVAVRRRRRRP